MSPLTHRERTILLMRAQGYSDAEIARCEGIAIATVRTRFGRVLLKLVARSSTHALARALQEGELTLEEIETAGIRRHRRYGSG